MKATASPLLDAMRQRHNARGDSPPGSMYGYFVRRINAQEALQIISSGPTDWEHVSVSAFRERRKSIQYRTPNWNEMCYVKNLFWNEDEVVLQLHPSKDEYVNEHPKCLHLWKKSGVNHELPPRILLA